MNKMIAVLIALAFSCSAFAQMEVKPLSKTEMYKTLAERTGLTKDQVETVLNEMAKLAHQEASKGFTIPDIGKLVVVDRAARTGRNPKTGETIQIPAKKAVKFRVAKACKDAILGTGN